MLILRKIVAFALFLICFDLSAQNLPTGIMTEDLFFKSHLINKSNNQSVTLWKIYAKKSNFEELSTLLGIKKPACKDEDSVNWCRFNTGGIKMVYSDYPGTFYFVLLELTNSNFEVQVKGVNIAVGDNIDLLKQVHLDGYNKRHAVPGETTTSQVLLYLEDSELSLSFEYETSTSKITSIVMFESIL